MPTESPTNKDKGEPLDTEAQSREPKTTGAIRDEIPGMERE